MAPISLGNRLPPEPRLSRGWGWRLRTTVVLALLGGAHAIRAPELSAQSSTARPFLVSDHDDGGATIGAAEPLGYADGALVYAPFTLAPGRVPSDGPSVARLLKQVAPFEALADDVELEVDRVLPVHGTDIVRFHRVAHGAPVLGTGGVLRLREGRLEWFSFARLARVQRVTPPRLGGYDALRPTLNAGERVRSLSAAWLLREGELGAVYRARLEGPSVGRGRVVVVDAIDGRLRATWPLGADALGRVYRNNPRRDDGRTQDVLLSGLADGATLTGSEVVVYGCVPGERGCASVEQTARPNLDGDFLYTPHEPAFDDPFAEVNAYFHATEAVRRFRERHAYSLICAPTDAVRVYVNVMSASGEAYNNATYFPAPAADNTQCGTLHLGQGDAHDFSYDASILYHEFVHLVLAEAAALTPSDVLDSLGVSYQPSAIDEGTADYLAASLSEGPIIGEYLGEELARDLSEPRRCPVDLTGEPHNDGMIWATAAWALRDVLGAARVDALVWTSVVSLGEAPTLAQLGQTVLATARGLEVSGEWTAMEAAAVEEMLVDHGLVGCTRITALDDGVWRRGFGGRVPTTATVGRGVAPVHYRIDVPGDATALEVTLARSSDEGTLVLEARAGSPVELRPMEEPALLSDHQLTPGDRGTIRWTLESDPPLPVGQTVYFAVRTTDLLTAYPVYYEIHADVVCGTEACGIDSDLGGCACRASPGLGGRPGPGGHGGVGLGLIVLALWRGRRATSRPRYVRSA